ncbi:MAG TPA: metal-sensitive transcriptional regulator [Syntrophomonadaceae bacterium]|nr:metal-sensitive transcriptional regulator [Syntrophomonadaceae bacterium]
MVIEVDKDKRNVILRLRRIEGQVRGVQRMIEEDFDCNEVLIQVAAIKSAVSQVGLIVFENHAHECIEKAINEDNEKDVFTEIVNMMSKLMK